MDPDVTDPSLAAAVAAGDGQAARRALAGLPADVRRDGILEPLAVDAAGGSALAVELLIEQLDELGVARAAVRRFLVDEDATDDVTQDTLIGVARAVGSFRGDARFRTWLLQIARYRVVDHLRRRRATSPLGDADQAAAAAISSQLASRESVRELLARLPAHYREAMVLRDVQRLTYEETAARLERNVNTVKAHVARGRAVLAAVLENDPPLDGGAPAGDGGAQEPGAEGGR